MSILISLAAFAYSIWFIRYAVIGDGRFSKSAFAVMIVVFAVQMLKLDGLVRGARRSVQLMDRRAIALDFFRVARGLLAAGRAARLRGIDPVAYLNAAAANRRAGIRNLKLAS